MFSIEKIDKFDFIKNYFFDSLKLNKIIPNDLDLLNKPFKIMILIKTSIISQSCFITTKIKLNANIL